MFVYDTKGLVYRVIDKGFQNIGISVKDDKHAVTIAIGKVVKKIDEAGRVFSIEEVLAKFHVTSRNPLKLASPEKQRNTEAK